MLSVPLLNGKKSKKHRSGRLNLEAISHLWTTEAPAAIQNDRPNWDHTVINGFYETSIKLYANDLGPAKPVLFELLTLLDRKGDISSCTPDDPVIYSEITLLDHTLWVSRNVLESIKYDTDRNDIIGRYLIISLGFSIGLLSDSKNINDLALKSLQILDPVISDLPDKLSIYQAIKESLAENNPKTKEGKILKTAISHARFRERETAVALAKAWGARITETDFINAIKREFADA